MPGTASLFPKEHGAYAQLAFPLVTGMALAMPTPSTVTLGLATFIFSLFRVHPKHLKRVGWSLVAANSLTPVLLLQG